MEYNLSMPSDTFGQVFSDLPVTALRYFETTTSTNDEALQWCGEGALDGSLVWANQQTAGRGRLSRRWITQPGSSLAFSLIFRPTQKEAAHMQLFSPLAAIAVCQALQDCYQVQAQIKWPNDVLANGKKLSGVLVEAAWLEDKLQGVVVGVGINIAPSSIPPANLSRIPATCVEDVVGKPVERGKFLAQVLKTIFALRSQMTGPAFLQTWEERLAFRQEWVCIDQPNHESTIGQVQGIDVDGNLRLIGHHQENILVNVGELTLRPL
jgi:BirA family transcriptional regulator, biotin operon repressor / biotin---[acetyl-CoA-carboxylase] ligase